MKINKVFSFFYLGLFFALSVKAQESSVNNALYFQLKASVQADYTVNQDKTIDIVNIPGIPAREISNEIQITKLTRPFTLNNDPKLLRTFYVEIKDANQMDKLIKMLNSSESIEFVERCFVMKSFWEPNDPYYLTTTGNINWNWHLDAIYAAAAKDIQQPNPELKVGIIDLAIWGEHPDLQIPSERQYDASKELVGSSSPNFTKFPQTIKDLNTDVTSVYSWQFSHGTHCAGNIAAINNNGIGVSSVSGGNGDIASGVQLYTAKASGSTQPAIQSHYVDLSYQWLVRKGCKIISMSLGGEQYSQVSYDIIKAGLDSLGTIAFAGAGNESSSVIMYPAGYDNVIAVGAVNSNYSYSEFSEYGDWVDIAGPGGCYVQPNNMSTNAYVLSTMSTHEFKLNLNFPTANPVDNDNDDFYDIMAGTSMACPIVASTAALVMSKKPNITFKEMQQLLQWSATPLITKNKIKYGCINAEKALQTVSIEENKADLELSVYPNPTSGLIYLNTTPFKGKVNIKVFNPIGECVINEIAENNSNQFALDFKNLRDGVYLINVSGNDLLMQKKIILTK